MAIILYPSGIIEEYNPKQHVFTDQEILHLFDEFTNIRTARLYEVPNTWCVWAEKDKFTDDEFNKLGSDILQEDVYCHVLFIHDTQIDPAWMLTDDIIYKEYDKFKEDLKNYFDKVAESVILEMYRNTDKEEEKNFIFLNTLGPTEDKRILFEFNPHNQSQEFYEESHFLRFCNKMIDFIKSIKLSKTFYIYFDKKTVIFIKDENIKFTIDRMIDTFNKKEQYENSNYIKNIYENWLKLKKQARKRKQPDSKK